MTSLLRSTKYIRYLVAGATKIHILIAAKPSKISLIRNWNHSSFVNNVRHDYPQTKESVSLDPLLHQLESDVRRYGRISRKDIDKLINEMKCKDDITREQSLVAIRCCGELIPEEVPEQRTALVKQIWSMLTERGVPMDISHYNALLRVYIENEHQFSPSAFLEELKQKGIQPDRVTYQRLIRRYCQAGDIESATKLLESMTQLGFPVSEAVLNALVIGYTFHGDIDGAKSVIETMGKSGIKPSSTTYTLLACGYARNGDVQGIQNVLELIEDECSSVGNKDLFMIVEALAVSGHGDKVDKLSNHLYKGAFMITDLCNFILRLINKGQEDIAKYLLSLMPNLGYLDNNINRGAFFVKQLVKVQKSDQKIVDICKDLQDQKLVPNALLIATEAVLQLGKVECAQLLFKELSNRGIEIRQHYYWPLLVKKGKENDEEGLLQILRDMSNNGLNPTGETLRNYVLPFIRHRNSSQDIIVKLQLANIPAAFSATNRILELLNTYDIRQAAEVAKEHKLFGKHALIQKPLLRALGETKDIKSFVTILQSLSSMRYLDEDIKNGNGRRDSRIDCNEVGQILISAVKILPSTYHEQLFDELISRGIGLNTETFETIEKNVGDKMSSRISEKLTKLRISDLENSSHNDISNNFRSESNNSAVLEKLHLHRRQNEFSNISRLEKQLLSAYIRENNVEKVSIFLQELKANNFELRIASLVQLIEFYAKNDNLEEALKYKTLLEQKDPGFVLNKYKLLLVAFAYVKANRVDEAVKFLSENRTDDETHMNSMCFHMLNYCADKKDPIKVKQLTKVLLNQHIVEPTNVLLGPLIRVHMINDDIDGALKEFEFCCRHYGCTPWKKELMQWLILNDDELKLKWMIDLSTQVHGEVNTLHDLIFTYIELGRVGQARLTLETLGRLIKPQKVDEACERYVKMGKSEYLRRFLKATKDLSYIDRSKIFYHLLKYYCDIGDTDKALGLWTTIQEENETPSDEFLICLGQHLRSNNRDVPFVIPDNRNYRKNASTNKRKFMVEEKLQNTSLKFI